MEEKQIIVIGGGPAGMMAALTAARQGGKVTLFERNDRKHPAMSSSAEHHSEAKADSSQPNADTASSDRLFLVTSSDFTCSVLVQNGNVARVNPTDETVCMQNADTLFLIICTTAYIIIYTTASTTALIIAYLHLVHRLPELFPHIICFAAHLT